MKVLIRICGNISSSWKINRHTKEGRRRNPSTVIVHLSNPGFCHARHVQYVSHRGKISGKDSMEHVQNNIELVSLIITMHSK